MSACYEIACTRCHVRLWIGQSSGCGYLYGNVNLVRFFQHHDTHPLTFWSEMTRPDGATSIYASVDADYAIPDPTTNPP